MKKIILISIIALFFNTFCDSKFTRSKEISCDSLIKKYGTENMAYIPPTIFDGGWTFYFCVYEDTKCVLHNYKVGGIEYNDINELNLIVKGINSLVVKGKLSFIGYTDSVGRKKDNLYLSKERAKFIAKKFRELGLKKEIEIENITGKGEEKPIDSNDTVEGRYNNRRVEIIWESSERCDNFIN